MSDISVSAAATFAAIVGGSRPTCAKPSVADTRHVMSRIVRKAYLRLQTTSQITMLQTSLAPQANARRLISNVKPTAGWGQEHRNSIPNEQASTLLAEMAPHTSPASTTHDERLSKGSQARGQTDGRERRLLDGAPRGPFSPTASVLDAARAQREAAMHGYRTVAR